MAKPTRLYWDSCAWLGLLNGEEDKKRELRIIYGSARNGKCEIWTSTLSMMECRRLKSEKYEPKPLDKEIDANITKMFRQTFVKPIAVSSEIVESARQLWRANEIGHWDAIHVASALWHDVGMMHTYDKKDLLELSGKFAGRHGKVLTISYPDNTTDGPLFGEAS